LDLAVSSLRVAFVTMPQLYADIMRASLAERTELQIVATLENRNDLNAKLQRLAADVIFLGLKHGETNEVARSALWSCPKSQIIGLSADARHVTLHFLQPQCAALNGADPPRIATAIVNRWLHPLD
jgi:N-acetyl-gamma-glutamylphosphate reductase